MLNVLRLGRHAQKGLDQRMHAKRLGHVRPRLQPGISCGRPAWFCRPHPSHVEFVELAPQLIGDGSPMCACRDGRVLHEHRTDGCRGLALLRLASVCQGKRELHFPPYISNE